MSGIRRAGEPRKIHFDREQFCLRPEGDEVSVMNLGNVYAEFCAARKDAAPKATFQCRAQLVCRPPSAARCV